MSVHLPQTMEFEKLGLKKGIYFCDHNVKDKVL